MKLCFYNNLNLYVKYRDLTQSEQQKRGWGIVEEKEIKNPPLIFPYLTLQSYNFGINHNNLTNAFFPVERQNLVMC